MRERFTMHDAVVVRCVWSRGIKYSWDPAKRRRKSSEEATRKDSDEKECEERLPSSEGAPVGPKNPPTE